MKKNQTAAAWEPPRYLTVAEIAIELRFDQTAPKAPLKACRDWLAREAIPVKRRGRVLLVERRVLEAKLNEW